MRSGGPTLRIRNGISGEMGSVRESPETANTKHSEERCGSNSFHDFDYIPFLQALWETWLNYCHCSVVNWGI